MEILLLFPLLILSIISRYINKKVDIGLGPEPLINNIYHKRALEYYGYSAETFVTHTYFITQDFDKIYSYKNKIINAVALKIVHIDFIVSIFRYRCLYFYFNGGPLFNTLMLWRFEPYLLKIAKVKSVVMPYGSDIQDLTRTPNFSFKHAMACDYPQHKFKRSNITSKINLWTTHASHVISGCDWVDYMYHWDTLMVAHFSFDTTLLDNKKTDTTSNDIFRVLHAPNHRSIKGTKHIIENIQALRDEGLSIELILLEKAPNETILQEIKKADLIIDQLIIGWYAMFAIEAMAHAKPVMCYLRDDLLQLYRSTGLINKDDPPLINTSVLSLKNDIKKAISNKHHLSETGTKGRQYVERIHSIKSIGNVFLTINKSMGMEPYQR
ncbi:MAG: glycosyltransferase [Candidatus Thiothrix moscowensis]|nr:glycosyltransferase [Candidatus Thiothrix moscowensis]